MSFKENIQSKFNESKSFIIEGLKKTVRFDEKNLLNNLPLLLLLALIGVIHVANNHIVELKIKNVEKLEKEIKELRWNYMTTKSELMYNSKQSEVAKMVKDYGLKEITKPPYKIEVNRNGN